MAVPKERVIRASFIFFFGALLAVAFFHLATPLLTVLFSYLILSVFKFLNRKAIAITLYLVVVTIVMYCFVYIAREAITALPDIASKSIPTIIDHAKQYGLQLPFTDLESLKTTMVRAAREEARFLASFAEVATRQFVFLIIGIVIAISIFVNGVLDLEKGKYKIKNNLYSEFCDEVVERIQRFYRSFRTVIGAQMIISAINTVATTILVFSLGLPYAQLIIVITFVCGLLPIIGNIISNTIIFGIAIVESLKLAIISLIFLIAVHKLEYFLNSKIIGGRIKNPMWLTLIGLIVGERMMGIPGMILAPVLLHYFKVEASAVEVK